MKDPRDSRFVWRSDAPAGLYLTIDGAWFHDGQRVGHPGLEQLLHRSIARDGNGDLVVTTGRDIERFACEDAPYLVRTLHHDALVLSDGTHELIAGRRFFFGPDQRLRCIVKARQFWALLSRSATQALMATVADTGDRVHPRGGPCPLVVVAQHEHYQREPALDV